MKVLIIKLTIATVFISEVVFAANIKCSVDKMDAKMVDVKVEGLNIENENSEATGVVFEGKKISATFIEADEFEPISELHMQIGDLTSIVYNPNITVQYAPINILTQGKIRFQCYIPTKN